MAVLLTRLLTAAVLIPLIVVGIVWLPTAVVGGIFAGVLLIGAWEWSRLLGMAAPVGRLCFAATYAVLAVAVLRVPMAAHPGVLTWLLVLACVWWLAAVYCVIRFPAGWARSVGRPVVGALVGLIVLVAAARALPMIHAGSHGIGLLLIFLGLIWGADSGAYFAGRALGRHKLAPAVSPGKTWEGVVGGVAAAVLVAVVGGLMLGYAGSRLGLLVVLGIWVALISIVGDLTLSMFKRHAGVKDSGTLFPGHGGVLDRLDSMLAAVPWYALGLSCLFSVD